MSRQTSMMALIALLLSAPAVRAQQVAVLTPQDYIAIQQLVSKYAYAIDECTNMGYDYADLYTPDGWFATSRNGKVLNKFEGRDRLAKSAAVLRVRNMRFDCSVDEASKPPPLPSDTLKVIRKICLRVAQDLHDRLPIGEREPCVGLVCLLP